MRSNVLESNGPGGGLAAPVVRPADERPARIYIHSLAQGSRRAQQDALAFMAREFTGGTCDLDTMPWERLRNQHLQAMRATLLERFAAATAQRYLSALRKVLKQAWRQGLMTAEDYHRAVDLDAIKVHRLPAGRDLQPKELAALFEACAQARHPATAARDAALLATLYALGPRRSEAARLPVDAYDRLTGQIRILGKGNKERTSYALNESAEALEMWLRHRGSEPGPLFCPITRGGRIQMRFMTSQAIYERARHMAGRAGIERFSPHDLRRTFVGDLLDAGADLSVVQQLAGHASPATTARYDRRGERAKRQAAGRLHVPYVRRQEDS